ncbi:MAG TPA: sigma-54 dependent transcriptional regulator, partial [Planctomycetota bacterium]|nr:sigma-54 dependent transcriptional regulator [Planctomycetota bacterium]
MPKVLVVDDEPAMLKVLSGFLAQEKIPSVTAPSGEAALSLLHTEDVGVIVTDLRMEGMDGLELLERALRVDPALQVILMTAHGTDDVGRRAWELGAAGYVRKPFDRDEILFEVRRALDKAAVGGAVAAETPGGMVGSSKALKEVLSVVGKVAPTNSTVLIRGESGTGKELVARAIHDRSKRKSKPFIKVICAALPETLIESELFGYERGAFTGAAASKPGRFELAEGGTIFLDEIGDLTPATQVKLLRVLQDRQFERLGGTQTLKADVRVLAATHRDLEDLVESGTFREDLFYRINVVPVRVPSLRERPEDIPALVEHFVARYREEHGKPSV